jgi:hypothetical protein
MLALSILRSASDDATILSLLCEETLWLLPNELSKSELAGHAKACPPGLRALSGIWDLDVSMAMDDPAWHFGNHHHELLLQETYESLRIVGADAVAEMFHAAWEIVKPHLPYLQDSAIRQKDFHSWLREVGIQQQIDRMNPRLWKICEEQGNFRLLQFVIDFAKRCPEGCVLALAGPGEI